MKTLLRCVVAALVVLAGGEVLVRTFVVGPSAQIYDPDIGYSYRPHRDLFQAKEGYARLRTNSLGLNDEEVGAKDGRCRVLVLGDSYTTSLQVPRNENFTSVAERLEPSLDVVNAGRDGLFLGDVHKVARRLVPLVAPDFVVYVISESDVEEDSRLPGLLLTVGPDGTVRDAVMAVESQELFKEMFAPVLSASALATRLSAQLQPSAAGAAELWLKLRDFAGAPALADKAPTTTVAVDDAAVLTFVLQRLARTVHPAAMGTLFVNALRYSSGHEADIAPTSAHAETVARGAAAAAPVAFADAEHELVQAVRTNGQPPFGFDNGLRPGGHLNRDGHEAVARALVTLVGTLRAAHPKACGT